MRGEPAAVDGAEQTVPPSVDHAAYGAGLSIALAPVTCDLVAIGATGVALAQLLDASELLSGVRGGEQAVLDASALGLCGATARYGGVGDAIAAGDGAADAIEGRNAQNGVLSIAAF